MRASCPWWWWPPLVTTDCLAVAAPAPVCNLVQDAKASSPDAAAKAEDLAGDLEKMGATFIKLGQLLSTRADLLPPAYMEALARLQDNVGPFPYREVEAIITSR